MEPMIGFAARMALEAYSDQPNVEGFIVRPFTSGHVQGFTARQGDMIWIVFCGTNDAADWLDNLDVDKEMMPFGGGVHAGFNHALDEVWENLLSVLDHGRWNEAHFVGHSLGGALAALAASRMLRSNFSRRKFLWTFGQPRCGDATWAQTMDLYLPDTCTRVFNAGDMVPHLPTVLRFSHAGRAVFFDHDGLRANPSKWHRLSEAFRAMVTFRKAPLAMLHAHSMRTYLINVMNSLENS
ncbi:MAG: lipase family protein [Magnetococcales bacterium]|nr:lipase family protein [Magnetococcales bacterium]